MSSSHGTGFPQFFECSVARSFYSRDPGEQRRMREGHDVTLTGRKRAGTRGNRHPRTSEFKREYVCSCGHTGWSNHIDLERMEQRSCA